MAVRKEYTEDLEKLKDEVQRMGELARESAKNAIKALAQRDTELASRILKENVVIDELEFDIENRCMRLLALQQPMASDLRTNIYHKLLSYGDSVLKNRMDIRQGAWMREKTKGFYKYSHLSFKCFIKHGGKKHGKTRY